MVLGLLPSILNAQVYQAAPGTTYTPTVNQNQISVIPNAVNQNQVSVIPNTVNQNQISVIPNDNIFLEYYAKQGDSFSASVYYNESGKLAKRDIGVDDLQRSVVIFSGDWCPYCHNFLASFSQYIPTLNAKGLKVIIVNVPSVDKLRNQEEPTLDEYNSVKSKFESYGITFSSNTKLLLLGEKATLARNGIEGLPVFIAVKNGKEYFRGVGQAGVSKLQLSDQNVLRQFLEIWDEDLAKSDSSDKLDTYKQHVTKKPKGATKHKKSTKVRKSKNPKVTTKAAPVEAKSKSKVDLEASRNATEQLNKIAWNVKKISIPRISSHSRPSRGCTCRINY